MTRDELQRLSETRLLEANVLLRNTCFDGAYYLAGYAIECALKACIAKRTRAFDFPDKELANKSHTHNLIALMKQSKLEEKLEEAMHTDTDLATRWEIVKNWSEASRYEPHDDQQAKDLIDAIEDHSRGLLPWIRLHW